MAFDELLASRVRKALGKRHGIQEKKMFGGLAFLLRGNMCCGVHGNELIVRLDPGDADRALSEVGARSFDLTGRPMKGWLLVQPSGVDTDGRLREWVDLAVTFAGSLPAKTR